jgi:cysteinyl-tRNA synthetase
MEHPLKLYNSLSRTKEQFIPLHPPMTGMYVCGPTVYGDPHLGHARPAITFDLLYRWLLHLGYKVRYVRNITDVGHLENDADQGEDKIAKKARLEQLEPMEVAQHYTNTYHESMSKLNVLSPGIEPRASGHIIEQIEMISKIMAKGFAYEVNGSVYFDVAGYNKQHAYGKLSGRIIEELEAGAGNERRTLEAQDEKRHPADFALWKKASPEHIMQWPSPWGMGFPGWHIECSAMSSKYLGNTFDIHGGGMDLLFPHHECEIAQSVACTGVESVRYWVHNNMITINGQKMGKSLGNFINLDQFFSGSHPLLSRAYSPMTIRFFILQAHYRSTLDFSNEALQAAEKALQRLSNSLHTLQELQWLPGTAQQDEDLLVNRLLDECVQMMNEDLNSAETIARLFELSRKINSIKEGHLPASALSEQTFLRLRSEFPLWFSDILGLKAEEDNDQSELLDGLMQLIIGLRKTSREQKDFATSDRIRDELEQLNIRIKDGKEGTSWTIKPAS